MKQQFARKEKRIKNKKRKKEVRAAYWGWCKWGDCRNLWNKLTNKDMSFLEKGIGQSGMTKDGKRFFDVPEQRLMEILNVPIIVIDFETGVSTSQGNDRYCVLFEMNRQKYKFITNCYNIKDVLDQAQAMEARGQHIFPVQTVIHRKPLRDGKSTYYMD